MDWRMVRVAAGGLTLALLTPCMREYIRGPAYPEAAGMRVKPPPESQYEKKEELKQMYLGWGMFNLTRRKSPEVPEHGDWYIIISRNVEDVIIFLLTGGFLESRTIRLYAPKEEEKGLSRER